MTVHRESQTSRAATTWTATPRTAGPAHGTKGRTGRRVLNLRAAVILGVIMFGALFALDRLHSRQYSLTREFIRQRGLTAAKEGNFSAAAVHMEQYLAMRPGDVEIRAQLSEILVDHVGTEAALQRAFRLNEDLLRDQIPQSDLRLRQAQLAMLLQKYSDAEAHLKILRTSVPDSSEVWLMTGECQLATRHLKEAQHSFEKSIQCEPAVPEAYRALCRLISETQPHSSQIDDLMHELKTRFQTADSWRIHADWNLSRGRLSEAAEDLELALNLEPDDLRSFGRLVQCLQQMPPSQESRQLLDRMRQKLGEQRQLNPSDNNLVVLESAVFWLQDQRAEAAVVLKDAIRRSPRSFVLHRTLMEQLLNDHQPDAASEILAGLPSGALTKSEYEFLTGRVHVERGELNLADGCFDRAIAFCPEQSPLLPRIQLAHAACRRQLGEDVHAVDAYRDVMTRDPNSASGRLGMAAVFLESGQTDLAIAEYQQLLDEPGVPAYLTNLIIQRNLELPMAVRNWTLAEQLVSDTEPRIEDLVQRRLLQVDLLLARGKVAEAYNHLADARQELPDRSELDRAVRRLNGQHGTAMAARLRKMLNHDPENTEIIAAIIRISLNQSTRDQSQEILDVCLEELIPAGWNGIRRLQAVSQTVDVIRNIDAAEGSESQRELMDEFQLEVLGQLVNQVPEEFPRLIRELQLQNGSSKAFETLLAADGRFAPEILHVGGLEFVRYLPAGEQCPTGLWPFMIRQIEAEPQNLALRRSYAEALLYADQINAATATLEQLTAFNSHDAAALARLAWIQTIAEKHQAARASLSAAEAIDARSLLVRIANTRLLIAEQKFEECLRELETLEQDFADQSVTAVYLGCVHDGLSQPELAKSWVSRARERAVLDPLLPPDAAMLSALSAKLSPSAGPVTAGR